MAGKWMVTVYRISLNIPTPCWCRYAYRRYVLYQMGLACSNPIHANVSCLNLDRELYACHLLLGEIINSAFFRPISEMPNGSTKDQHQQMEQ